MDELDRYVGNIELHVLRAFPRRQEIEFRFPAFIQIFERHIYDPLFIRTIGYEISVFVKRNTIFSFPYLNCQSYLVERAQRIIDRTLADKVVSVIPEHAFIVYIKP